MHHLEKISNGNCVRIECAQEKGTLNGVTAIPSDKYDYFLHKDDFRDALSLRYSWHPNNLPIVCTCGKPMSVDHAHVCHKGGYTITQHNALRDFTATLLSEVCPDTSTEPPLQPLSEEGMELLTANCDEEARLDIKVLGFWCAGQEAFFNIRAFHQNASFYSSRTLKSIYRQHKQEKKRCYGQRVRDVERAAFTPLVFCSLGNGH